MPLFRKTHYDRRATLEKARRAQTRGSLRAAVGLYREVLAVEPDNPELHAKLAPLLHAKGDERGAWDSYIYAGRAYLQEGLDQKALSLFRQAARKFPMSPKIWEQIADIHLQRGRKKEAAAALYEGGLELRSERLIELSVRLLLRAFRMDPTRPEYALSLAKAFAISGRFPQARRLLRDLRANRPSRALRIRIAWTELWLFPTWRALTDWLRETWNG